MKKAFLCLASLVLVSAQFTVPMQKEENPQQMLLGAVTRGSIDGAKKAIAQKASVFYKYQTERLTGEQMIDIFGELIKLTLRVDILRIAIEQKDAHMVEFLLGQGASSTASYNDGYTPLTLAQAKLLEVQAVHGKKIKKPLAQLMWREIMPKTQVVIQFRTIVSFLKNAIEKRFAYLKPDEIMYHQIDGEQTYKYPLIWAVKYNNIAAARAALNLGANPNPTGNELAALVVAIREKNTDMVKLLLAQGADPNYEEPSFGLTAVVLAALYDVPEIMQILVDRGAHVNKRNQHERLPIDAINFIAPSAAYTTKQKQQAIALLQKFGALADLEFATESESESETEYSSSEEEGGAEYQPRARAHTI